MTFVNVGDIIKKRYAVALSVFAFLIIALIYSVDIVKLTYSALILCAESIIPALFIYMVASDILMHSDLSFIEKSVGKIFSAVFGFSGACAVPFILGCVCGFPIGGKCICNLYDSGRISKKEAEIAIGICNNTGPSFVIAGIGASMLNDINAGVAIYLSQIIAIVTVGAVFGNVCIRSDSALRCYSEYVSENVRHNSIIDSIASSAYKLVSVCGCIVFFSVVSGVIVDIINIVPLKIVLSGILEVGSAANYISSFDGLEAMERIAFISSAVSFSGISVFSQVKLFSDKSGLSLRWYLIEKAFSTILSFLIVRIIIIYILC